MSTYKRVNTIKINFDPAATRPAALEIHHWLVNYIGLNIDQVDTVQLNSRERAIYVKVMRERESDVLPVKDKIKRKQHDNKEIVLLTIDPPTGRSAYKSNISGNNHPVTSNDKSMEKMDTLSSSGMIQESTQNDLQLETQEGKERAKQQEQLIPEYKCTTGFACKTISGECVYAEMQEIKHKLCAIQKNVMEGTAIRARQLSMAAEERSALYHIVKEKQRGQMHYITNLKNTNGDDLKTTKQCLNEARNYYTHLYQRTPTSEEASNFLLQGVKHHINLDQHDAMARQITLQEIESALKQTTSNTAPGPDGLTYNFYKSYWQYVKDSLLEAFNEIYIEHKIPLGFTDGIIVLIPKRSPKTITDFRPISLLNTDYKLLMKVMANRLKEVLPDIIKIGQTCGIPGRNIFENLATVSNAIMHYHIHPNEQAALISLDLEKAFDNIDHQYMYRVLERFNIPVVMLDTIRALYETAHSKISVNGYLTTPVKIEKGIRQGCPLSTILFAIIMEPCIRSIYDYVSSISTNKNLHTVRAYADDISFLIQDPNHIHPIKKILSYHMEASGAKINYLKSSLLPLGKWPVEASLINIPTQEQIKILGIVFTRSLEETLEINWSKIVGKVKDIMLQQLSRNLNIIQRIWHINAIALAQIWYTARILPLPEKFAQQIERAVGVYLWKGHLYKVNRLQIRNDYKQGGLRLTAVSNKAQAIMMRHFITTLHGQGMAIRDDPTCSLVSSCSNTSTSIFLHPYHPTEG
ncbi:hypothetical protein ANN_18705 [Periplaneta americana]|uniref:Reverse transcriptase domain-containing protein n=1 Tax=Periplaneta americana TaxID=6978 RepID=A0ABQ8SPG6_PERAM|nr:hypothetical protein ANN_18705 [Periplaneta americana]